MQKKPLIVYIDDEVENLNSFRLNFLNYYNIEIFENPEDFLNFLREHKNLDISIVIADYRMPKIDGISLMIKLKELLPSTRRIIISAYDDTNILIESINKAQIHKFILKPWEKNSLLNSLEEQIEFYELTSELNKKYEELKIKNLELIEIKKKLEEENKILKNAKKFGISLNHKIIKVDDEIKIVIANQLIQQIFNKVEKLKDFIEILFLTGERGVGKKILAKYIFNSTKKFGSKKSFFCLDSFLLKDNLNNELIKILNQYKDESIMIYITNIEEIPKSVQKELYILLSDKIYLNNSINIENKIMVFSSTKNLEIELSELLVEELLYFLLPHHINLPPLRFRKDEIPYLINYFVDYYSKLRTEPIKVNDQTYQFLIRYKWPGNIDELKNNIKSAVLLADKEINANLFTLLPNFFEEQFEVSDYNYSIDTNFSEESFEDSLKFLEVIRDFNQGKISEIYYDDIIDEFEKIILQIALKKTNGNKAKAANILNLKPGKLLYKTKYLGL